MTLPHLRLTGAQILHDGTFTDGAITVADGILHNTGGRDLDLSGYWLLPGIIDLHGDAFERHMAPRPSAPFSAQVALTSTDLDAATCGVTTAWMAQSWSWEGGSRGPAAALNFLETFEGYRPNALTDLRVQLRCETYTFDTLEMMTHAIRRFGVDYVVFNDHLWEAKWLGDNRPDELIGWAARAGRTVAQHMELVEERLSRQAEVQPYLEALMKVFNQYGVRSGSHDDASAAIRDQFHALGARTCEFPTAVEPAQRAKELGDPILMGAPNVARGGSQSGNIAAEDLVRAGLCDALVSDYHYASMPLAAFALADRGAMSLGQAWQMISTNPADIMSMSDRGRIAAGQRADLAIVNMETRAIEGTLSGGRWSHLAGDLAGRLSCMPQLSIAAE